MTENINFLNLDLNDIYRKALKYQVKCEQNRKYVNEYQTKKRAVKDEEFLKKQREYARTYYIKNKEKVDKNNRERQRLKYNAESSSDSDN